jgi:hypothetical protein
MAPLAMAQSVTGAVAGRANAGEQITITNPATGLSRTVTVGADGTYRVAQLPPGDYTLVAGSGEPLSVGVSLGSTTTVNLAGAGAVNLDVVQVIGSRIINRVDVRSTETATNVTREDIARLPVDQNIASVAMLAPGVIKGDSSFGGLSFGGSSVAENSFYINGLNVTDFYNRNGFSSAPFAFYKEFQVKTGGYSVEFGRSTGGVINAVTRSGSNDFDFGVEYTAEPSAWQAKKKDRYNDDGSRYITAGDDHYSLLKMNMFASGPIIKDRLFFFAMYEARDYSPQNTNNEGNGLTKNESDDGFWGTKLDWHINDSNLLELMAFSDKNSNVGDAYDYDYDTGVQGLNTNTVYSDTGGRNWNLTYTSHFTDALSMKLMYGENERESFVRSLKDLECNYVTIARTPVPPTADNVTAGCTNSSTVRARLDDREAARADFEWSLGDH